MYGDITGGGNTTPRTMLVLDARAARMAPLLFARVMVSVAQPTAAKALPMRGVTIASSGGAATRPVVAKRLRARLLRLRTWRSQGRDLKRATTLDRRALKLYEPLLECMSIAEFNALLRLNEFNDVCRWYESSAKSIFPVDHVTWPAQLLCCRVHRKHISPARSNPT